MVTVILTIALIGVLVYFIETYLPMTAPFRVLIRVIVTFVMVLYLLRVFGFVDLPMPHR